MRGFGVRPRKTTVAEYTFGYFGNAHDRRRISPPQAERSKAGGGVTLPRCVSGVSLEKSGDLSSSSARTAVFVLTFRNAGAARLYSRSVSSPSTRLIASWSSPIGNVPDVIPVGV